MEQDRSQSRVKTMNGRSGIGVWGKKKKYNEVNKSWGTFIPNELFDAVEKKRFAKGIDRREILIPFLQKWLKEKI